MVVRERGETLLFGLTCGVIEEMIVMNSAMMVVVEERRREETRRDGGAETLSYATQDTLRCHVRMGGRPTAAWTVRGRQTLFIAVSEACEASGARH